MSRIFDVSILSCYPTSCVEQTGHVGGTAEQPRSSVTHTLRQRPSFCESQISQKSVLETFQATHESYQTDVTCPICHDIYTKPRFLRCYHSFCETCLEGIYKSNFPSQIIRCPFKCPLKTVMGSIHTFVMVSEIFRDG